MKNTWEKMNEYGKRKESFLFIVDYEKKKPLVWRVKEIPKNILFQLPEFSKNINHKIKTEIPQLYPKEFPLQKIKNDIKLAQKFQENGESYLLNLTYQIELKNENLDLKELFYQSNSDYKFLWDKKFLSYSPESFIRIKRNTIYTYPMKGTILGSITEKNNLSIDPKEVAEHNTVVDLLRNDLNSVAKNIMVNKYRYQKKIKTLKGDITQTSSEIIGQLDNEWSSSIGDIINTLTPAGSISGAPKRRTLEIINSIEKIDRGYYTGIFGLYHNDILDTGVLIRFIEESNSKFYYRTGAGITINSDTNDEALELKNKIYVPI